jgi:hypothetical protein
MCALAKVDALSFWKKYQPKAPVVNKISVAMFSEGFHGLVGRFLPPIRLRTDHFAHVTKPPPSPGLIKFGILSLDAKFAKNKNSKLPKLSGCLYV